MASLWPLIATTTGRIVVRREIEVNDEPKVMPPIDLTAKGPEGTSLAKVALTASNQSPGEKVTASVDLSTARSPLPARVYFGSAASAKIVPNSVLIATDRQFVAMQATKGNATRELRYPFRESKDSSNNLVTLPDAFGDAQLSTMQ